MDWSTLITQVVRSPAHRDITVSKDLISHPKYSDFVNSIGEPQSQISDYRKRISGGRSIHVRKYDHHFKIHWDNKDPESDPLGHLLEDATHWLVIAGIAVLGIGALIYFASNRDKKKRNS